MTNHAAIAIACVLVAIGGVVLVAEVAYTQGMVDQQTTDYPQMESLYGQAHPGMLAPRYQLSTVNIELGYAGGAMVVGSVASLAYLLLRKRQT